MGKIETNNDRGRLSLGGEPGLRPLAFSLFLQSFLLGIPQLFTATAAAALFLDAFSAGKLPYVIMAGGVLVPILGFLLSAALTRWGATKTLRATLALLVAGLGTLALLLAVTGGAAPVRLALIVWVDVEYAFTELSFAAHANRILDIRQAKRLFGLVSAGQVLAAMVGGLAAPALLRHMPVGALLGFSLFGLVGAWLNFERMGARHPLATDGYPEEEARAAATVRNPLVRLIFLLVFLEFCVQAFSETIFYNGLQHSRPDAGAMASFLGLFFALAGACKLAIALFGTKPLLARFGLRLGLLAPALLMALPLALQVFSPLLGGFDSAPFLPLILVRFLQTVALSSLYAPAYFTLYQPLRPGLRSSAQALADTAVGQLGSGFAGLLLFLFLDGFKLGFSFVGAATLALLLVWSLVALRAEKRYRAEVTALARGGIRGSGEQSARTERATLPGETQAELAALLAETQHARRGERLEVLFQTGRRIEKGSGDPPGSPYRRVLELEAALCRGYRAAAVRIGTKALGAALDVEADKAMERILLILGLAYPRDAVSALRHGLLFAEGGAARSYALELAETTLAGADRGLILPLFEDARGGPSRPAARGADPFFLRTLADEAEAAGRGWLLALVLLELSTLPAAAGSLGEAELALLEREKTVIDRVLSLAEAPLFGSVPHEELAALAASLEERTAAAGTRILTRGEEGSELFIIVTGRVGVSIEGREVARMRAGEVFGELSALSPERRSADVTALEEARLLVLRGELLAQFSRSRWRTAFEMLKVLDRRIVTVIEAKCPLATGAPPPQRQRRVIGPRPDPEKAAAALSLVPALRSLDRAVLEDLVRHVRLRSLESGESLFAQGEEARAFYYLLSGRMAFSREDRMVFEAGPGEAFGDVEVALGLPRATGAAAAEPTELLDLPGRSLTDLAWVGPDFLRSLVLAAVDRLRLVNTLPEAKKEDRCSA